MYYVKHKTTNITNIPRGQALYSTIDYSNALWTCNSSELLIRMKPCEHSGEVFRTCVTNSDSKELFDCICRGEIQLTMVYCGTLWTTICTLQGRSTTTH